MKRHYDVYQVTLYGLPARAVDKLLRTGYYGFSKANVVERLLARELEKVLAGEIRALLRGKKNIGAVASEESGMTVKQTNRRS